MSVTFDGPDRLRVIFRFDAPATQVAGGGISEATFMAEVARRTAGDDLQSITVGNLASFQAAVAAQADSDQPLELVFSTKTVIAAGTAQQQVYEVGDVLYYSPRSQAPERRFNAVTHAELATETKQRRDGDEINEYAGIATADAMTAQLRTHNARPEDVLRAGLFAITGNFDTAARSYRKGQRWYLAPYHNAEAELVLLNDAVAEYAARLAVWPPNVAKHTDFQRSFQSTLTALDPALATDAGSTGTRFANVFKLLTRLADGTVVTLHNQGWSYVEDDRQTIPWEVSADEFNAVGASAATNGVEVWGEFRAVYGGGVDELRGRTNPFFIDFGEGNDWPATRGEVDAKADGLTVAQKIGLLQFDIRPKTIDYKHGAKASALAAAEIALNVANHDLLDGDVWFEVNAVPDQGAAFVMSIRVKWGPNAADIPLGVSLPSDFAAKFDRNIPVQIDFYDAIRDGNLLERIRLTVGLNEIGAPRVVDKNARYSFVASDFGDTFRLIGAAARTFLLPLINLAGVGIGWFVTVKNASTGILTLDGNGAETINGAATLDLKPGEAVKVQAVAANAWEVIGKVDVPSDPVVLQAAVAGGDDAGSASIQLPANYQDYRDLDVVLWGRGKDRIAEKTFRTAMLAVQANNQVFLVDGNLDSNSLDNAGYVTWTTATRTLTAGNQDRIIFAELHD